MFTANVQKAGVSQRASAVKGYLILRKKMPLLSCLLLNVGMRMGFKLERSRSPVNHGGVNENREECFVLRLFVLLLHFEQFHPLRAFTV